MRDSSRSPHLNLIIPQRTHKQIASHWRLGPQYKYKFWRCATHFTVTTNLAGPHEDWESMGVLVSTELSPCKYRDGGSPLPCLFVWQLTQGWCLVQIAGRICHPVSILPFSWYSRFCTPPPSAPTSLCRARAWLGIELFPSRGMKGNWKHKRCD